MMHEERRVDVVCVGAHPDDVEIGMGATVAKLTSAGASVAIVDLTNGEPTPFGTPELRAHESAKAAQVLGASRITLSQENRRLFDNVEAREELATVLRRLRPRVMFVPYAVDAHPDHVSAAQIAMAARFYGKFVKTEMPGEPHYVQRVFSYMAVHQRIIAQPSFVVEVADHMPAKVAALRAYASQFESNPANAGVVSMMEDSARMWGGLANVAAGEPFFALETIALVSPLDVL